MRQIMRTRGAKEAPAVLLVAALCITASGHLWPVVAAIGAATLAVVGLRIRAELHRAR